MRQFSLFTLAIAFTCVGAFGQGKMSMLNDTTRLVYFGFPVKPADAAYGGQLALPRFGGQRVWERVS